MEGGVLRGAGGWASVDQRQEGRGRAGLSSPEVRFEIRALPLPSCDAGQTLNISSPVGNPFQGLWQEERERRRTKTYCRAQGTVLNTL